jgi:hypothetical protein
MKFATFLAAGQSESVEDFQQWLQRDYAPAFTGNASGLVHAIMRLSVEPPPARHVPGTAAQTPNPAYLPYHALIESWFVTAEDFRRTAREAEPMLREHGARFVSYRTTPLLEMDPRFAEGGSEGRRPALTLITPVKWLPDLPKSEARRHWDEHVSTALRVHIGITKYERNWVDEVVSWSIGAEPVDAYADFSFTAIEDYAERFFPGDADRLEVNQDIVNFISSGSALFFSDARRMV